MPHDYDPGVPLSNALHEAFAQNLAKGSSQRQAYIDAGYQAEDNVADASAARLLRNVKVAARVEWLKSQAAERAIVTTEEVLKELKAIALSKQTDYLSWGLEEDSRPYATLKSSKDLNHDQIAAVQSVKVTPGMFGTSVELKLHNKLRALKLLGDHLGIFKPQEADETELQGYLEQLERAKAKYGDK